MATLPIHFKGYFQSFTVQRDVRVLGQAAVKFGIGGVVQHVNHAGAADSRRIVHPGLAKP